MHDAISLAPIPALVLGILLVAVNGFFVAAEFALVKLRATQIEPLVERGDRRAIVLARMLRNLDAYLSACQLGITLASLALGWIGEPAFAWLLAPIVERLPWGSPALLHSLALTLAFATITVLHIVIGEQAPKSFAIRRPEPTSLWIALPLFFFYVLTYPAIWLLNQAAIAALRPFGLKATHDSDHSAEELRLLLAATPDSELSPQKRQLLDNVFQLSRRTARQIMLPRGDVVYLNTDRSIEENLSLARESGHTRFPLCRGELDRVFGLVHIKDLFRHGGVPKSLTRLVRPIAFVPESLQADRLLRRMRSEQGHMAAVLDEYGGVSGIVTLENVIEEIVGEIQDEFDAEAPELTETAPGTWEVNGALRVDEVETALGLELSDQDADTIGGVVTAALGRLPEIGDQLQLGAAAIEVLAVELRRVRLLRVTLSPAATGAANED